MVLTWPGIRKVISALVDFLIVLRIIPYVLLLEGLLVLGQIDQHL